MKRYWLSCDQFTVGVDVDAGGTVASGAPIVRRFVGQPFANLLRWARGLGDLRVEEL